MNVAVRITTRVDQRSASGHFLALVFLISKGFEWRGLIIITRRALSSNNAWKGLRTQSSFKIIIYECCVVILKEELFYLLISTPLSTYFRGMIISFRGKHHHVQFKNPIKILIVLGLVNKLTRPVRCGIMSIIIMIMLKTAQMTWWLILLRM